MGNDKKQDMVDVVIIPVHNQLDYVKKCIQTVKRFTNHPFIIAVDDASDNETKDFLDKNVTVCIHSYEQNGFTRSCNLGIKYAMENLSFDILCLLNSDTEIFTGFWFDSFRSNYDLQKYRNKKLGVSGPLSNMTWHTQGVGCFPIYPKPFGIRINQLIHGFCFFIPKYLLDHIGLLNEADFPDYGSEDEYCLRAVKNDYLNFIDLGVFVYHHESKSYGAGYFITEMKKKAFANLERVSGKENLDLALINARESKEYIESYINGFILKK